MQRLKKFNTKDINKKPVIIIVGIFAVVISLIVGISFAEYKTEDEVLFINAKVADFRVYLTNISATSTNNSINLSYTGSGLNATTTCAFGATQGTYNINATSVNNSNCTKTGLNQNTTYYYKVCTKNNLKQEECKEGSIITKYDPPTLSDITATSTTNSIKLTYTSGGYAENFACWYGTSADNMKTSAPMSFSECNITGLQPGTTYYYNVNLRNNGGEAKKTGSIATKLNPPTVSNITAISTYNTINLSYTMSGTITGRTCKYGTTNGSYTNSVSNPTNIGCSITGLAENTTYYYQVCASNGGGQNCKTGSIKTKILLSNKVRVGDYIKMTPTATSYTIPASLTGYTKDQTINPSELNLWRVIRINSDGTVEMVSDKISSVAVYFSGSTGYKNFVGTLQLISEQYKNGDKVVKTRHFGYDNQILNLNFWFFNQGASRCGFGMKSTYKDYYYGGSGCDATTYTCGANEKYGLGDIGFFTDYNLVMAVYGGLEALDPTGSAPDYWTASRHYSYNSSDSCSMGGRYVGNDKTSTKSVYFDKIYSYRSTEENATNYNRLRPIVTLKSELEHVSGSGTNLSPFVFN